MQNNGNQVRVRITSAGEEKYWMEHTRKNVVNCAPSPGKTHWLYLPLSPETTGSTMMIQSDTNLAELAISRGGPETYALKQAFCFNKHHRKAKAQLNRSIVLGLSIETSPFYMVKNVMCGKQGPMELNPDLSHLGDVKGLQQLFNSDKLYTDAKVHALWAGLFASGAIYGCSRAGPNDKLDKIVDVDYEAHARYEMVSRLSCQGWRHGYTPTIMASRAEGFRKIRKLVRRDRLNNLQAAEALRLNPSGLDSGDESRLQALGSGGLADTTDDEDEF
jgi:hypothetical protein